MAKKNVDFEELLKELGEIVETMEQGQLTLENSLKHFERGIKLTRQCQQALTSAEQRVEKLTKEQTLVSFDTPEEDHEEA